MQADTFEVIFKRTRPSYRKRCAPMELMAAMMAMATPAATKPHSNEVAPDWSLKKTTTLVMRVLPWDSPPQSREAPTTGPVVLEVEINSEPETLKTNSAIWRASRIETTATAMPAKTSIK
jgi:hypothetical protein